MGGVEGGEEGEEEPVRLLQEAGRPHRICMQVWRYVLRDPPLQRQARLHVRLRCSWQVGDRCCQSRDRRRESRQNLRPTRTTTSVIRSRSDNSPLTKPRVSDRDAILGKVKLHITHGYNLGYIGHITRISNPDVQILGILGYCDFNFI